MGAKDLNDCIDGLPLLPQHLDLFNTFAEAKPASLVEKELKQLDDTWLKVGF